MDGGSTDGTLDILSSFGDRLNFISMKDDGQSDAINKGLSKCTGEIFGFLNSDDALLPGAIQNVVTAFVNHDAMWVTGDYRFVDENGRPTQPLVTLYKRILRRHSSPGLIHLTNYIAQQSTFWSLELMEKIGKFDVSLRYTMDYDFWLRAYQVAPPVILKKPLSEFRIHGESKGSQEFESQFDEDLQVLKRYSDNPRMIFCHRLHNQIIKSVYRVIK